ncbi:hypothetical protein D3C84_739740 [compost metagenome]
MDLAAVLVRIGDLTALAQQVAIGSSSINLSPLAACGMDACVKRRAGAQDSFDRQSTNGQGARKQVFALEQTAQSISSGDLGTVEQRQALFGSQRQRRQTGHLQGFGGFQPFALITGFAFSQQHEGHVRQRCQVTRCADRTF